MPPAAAGVLLCSPIKSHPLISLISCFEPERGSHQAVVVDRAGLSRTFSPFPRLTHKAFMLRFNANQHPCGNQHTYNLKIKTTGALVIKLKTQSFICDYSFIQDGSIGKYIFKRHVNLVYPYWKNYSVQTKSA